ncbi:hypothetical protein [Shewanella sp. MBTL60-007]|uniref:hypothetical protein n=1 Tax=Shewanella sp. MBTL60-007 TaxID=2815911 RepID=UPI001BC39B7D|nr:hypothetical protein [Shewanella sp. MBTL60-007]GIU20965.1 hypothetical protein TUM3792_21260 [Shewanella sp. MBTL60-007]
MTPKRFEVYLNKRAMGKSHKRIYSLRDAKSEIVKFSNALVLLSDVEMVVQTSGREDTLSRLERGDKITRTVHAFLRGNLLYRGRNALKFAKELGLTPGNSEVRQIGYNPIKSDCWLSISGQGIPNDVSELEQVVRSNYALMHESGIIVM